MKSKILILIITSFFSLHTYSQIVWAPQSAKWTYNGQGQTISYIEIKYVKDTLLLGKQSKVLEKTEYAYRSQTNDIVAIHLGNEITYEEDSVVYLYTYNQFDTLFSFNSSIGNSWQLKCYTNSGICMKNAKVTIQDTGTIRINDYDLKYLAVIYNYDTIIGMEPYIVQDTIIERIGSVNLYFLPWDIINSMLDANEGSRLRCYDDNKFGSYSNKFDKACDYTVSVNHIEIKELNIYPNPCNSYLNIEFAKISDVLFEIRDISGHSLLIDKSYGKAHSIDISFLPSGIHFLIITTSDGKFYRKIIKT